MPLKIEIDYKPWAMNKDSLFTYLMAEGDPVFEG